MSSRRKDKQIDLYEDYKHSVKAVIYLTPEDQFKAVIGADILIRSTRDELNRAIRESIRVQFEIAWQPVIYVEMSKPFAKEYDDSMLGIEFDRFYLGARADGGVSRVDWNIEESSRFDNMKSYTYLKASLLPLTQPHALSKSFETSFLLPYSDQTWAALEQLKEMIRAVHARLYEILSTPGGYDRLFQVGARVLAALPEPGQSAKESHDD